MVVDDGGWAARALERGRTVDVARQAQALAQTKRQLFGLTTTGARLGRHILVERVGAGGLAEVYLAYDPKLDRKVAIKIQRSSEQATQAVAEQRFVREAQAAARVTHPNVVGVFDAGTYDDSELPQAEQCGLAREGSYLVMEFMAGGDLRAWLDAEPRSRTAILSRFVEAGHGLSAAHEAGVVHRDFKPTNVLLTEQGHAKVADFGVARLIGATTGDTTDGATDRLISTPDSTMTLSGDRLGTPAFMPPEQARGDDVGPEADQYAFCLALLTELVGYPFPEDSAQILQAKQRGPSPAVLARLPRWLSRVLARGLNPDADRRHPTMRALVRALDPARRRRRLTLGAAITGAVAAATGLGASSAETPCPTHALASWSNAHRLDVRRAFSESGLPYAQQLQSSTMAALDDFAGQWSKQKNEVCEALRQQPTRRALHAANRCLDRLSVAFDTLVVQLADADPRTLSHADRMMGALEPPEGCRRGTPARRLDELWAPDRTAITRGIGRAEVLLRAGDLDGALETGRGAAAEARRRGEPELEGRARTLVGRALIASRRTEQAEDELRHAIIIAERSGSIADAVWAMVSHADALSHNGHHEQADAFAAMAYERALASSEVNLRVRANAALIYAVVASRAMILDAAEARLERAREVLGDSAPEFLQEMLLQARSSLRYRQGRFDEALADDEALFEGMSRRLGQRHPSSALARSNLGVALMRTGQLERSRETLQAAISVLEDNRDDDSPILIPSLHTLRLVERWAGDHEAELVHARRVLKVWKASKRSDPFRTATFSLMLAAALVDTGSLVEAQTLIDSVRPWVETEQADASSKITLARVVAALHLRLGDTQHAVAASTRGMEQVQAVTGASEWYELHLVHARALIAAGQREAAVPVLDALVAEERVPESFAQAARVLRFAD